jgi:hypothetical protein
MVEEQAMCVYSAKDMVAEADSSQDTRFHSFQANT